MDGIALWQKLGVALLARAHEQWLLAAVPRTKKMMLRQTHVGLNGPGLEMSLLATQVP